MPDGKSIPSLLQATDNENNESVRIAFSALGDKRNYPSICSFFNLARSTSSSPRLPLQIKHGDRLNMHLRILLLYKHQEIPRRDSTATASRRTCRAKLPTWFSPFPLSEVRGKHPRRSNSYPYPSLHHPASMTVSHHQTRAYPSVEALRLYA